MLMSEQGRKKGWLSVELMIAIMRRIVVLTSNEWGRSWGIEAGARPSGSTVYVGGCGERVDGSGGDGSDDVCGWFAEEVPDLLK